MQELEKTGVVLEAGTETVESSDLGKLISYIRQFSAKLEAEKIKERTLRGKRERMRRGKLPTGRGVLYGYDYDKEQGINLANGELETVKMVGQWLIQEGVFLNEVCRRLMAMNIPAPKGGKRWSRGTIGRIMRNPVYVGKSYANKTRMENKRHIRCSEADRVLIPDAVNKIAFTETEWELIQRQLDRNTELSPRNQKLSYLLSGRLYCQQCGRKYYGVPVHGKPYYRCSGRIKVLSDKNCTNKTVNATRLDEAVWLEVANALRKLLTILAGIPELKNQSNQAGFWEVELTQIDQRLKSLDREQEQLLRWALKGFPEDTVIRENEKINRKRSSLMERITELEKKLAQAKESDIDLEKVEEFCKVASENLDNFGYTEKEMALEVLRIRVYLDGDNPPILEGDLPVPDEELVMSQHS